MSPVPNLTRRHLLALGASGAGLAACGAPNSAADADTASNVDVKLPTFAAWQGPPPDVPGTPEGIPDLYDHYPAEPPARWTSAPGDGREISILTRTDASTPPGRSRNTFWAALEDSIGSPLDITLVPASDWGTKFATICAGGKLPDLMAVEASMRALPQFLAAETVDLQEFLSGDRVLDYPYLANLPADCWRRCVVGGGLHGIPIPRGILLSNLVYGRGDLLAQRGVTELPADFDDALALFTEVNSPQENTWTFANMPLDWLRAMLSVPNGWQPTDDGSLVHSYESDRQEEALELGRRMWEAGIVHPDAFAGAGTAFKQIFAAGRSLFMLDTYSAWPQFYEEATTPDYSLLPMVLPTYQGRQGTPWFGNYTYGIAAITTSAQDRVETMLSVMDWFAAPFGTAEYLMRRYGLEGRHHTLEGTDPVLTDEGLAEYQLGTFYVGDAPRPIYLPGRDEAARLQRAHMEATVPFGQRNATENYYSETQSKVGKALDATMGDLANAILAGREPVSAWRPAVADWRAGGGEAMRQEFLEAREKAAVS
jgi:putative aldouronate transport system substrate-binding protein